MTLYAIVGFAVQLSGAIGPKFGVSLQVTMIFLTFEIIITAAILLAGLPFVRHTHIDTTLYHKQSHTHTYTMSYLHSSIPYPFASKHVLRFLPYHFQVMDPFIHLPIMWATFMLGWRWYGHHKTTRLPPNLAWASPEMARGVSWASFGAFGLVTIFMIAAAVILWMSRLCIPERQNSFSSANESSTPNRSPGTARSTVSITDEEV